MFKFLSRIAGALTAVGCLAMLMSSCSDDDKKETPIPEPPKFSVAIGDVERTSVEFSVSSAEAADYAYLIAEKGTANIASAEELFEQGTSSMLESTTTKVSSIDVEGDKEYELFVATRRINPYVYSEVKSFDFSTDVPYTKLVTLNRIGYTDFSYHVKVPETGANVKHLVVRKNDYEGVKSILGGLTEVTEEIYLKVFGALINESKDFAFDKYGKDASGTGYDIHIHSDNTFLVMAGIVGDDGNIDPDQFECVEFNTRKAEVTPHEVNVAIETTSTAANVTITPDPDIVSYRALIEAKSEYDYWRREGEQQVRYTIIGHWDDETNAVKREYTGTRQLKATGLIPNKQYIVGIVAFDAQGRESYKEIEFVTGEPTGPAPTLNVTEVAPESATLWNSKAYNVKATNAAEVRYGYWLKSQFDNALGNNTTMATLIESNGMLASADQLAAISSEGGLTFETNDLKPETEYIFGVYARTDEYVTAVEYRTFTTEEMPQVGGAVRKRMPGNYLASTTDIDGNKVTFPVTITTGVNDATTVEYNSLNRLVALGFGPAEQFPYVGPENIAGDDADAAYGPKWFIEFTEDGIHVPSSGSSKSWSMGTIDNHVTYMTGYGFRIAANGRLVQYSNNDMTFDVEVSEDGNTITVKKAFYGEFAGTEVYMNPAMFYPGTGWFASDNYLFQCGSELVLTRQATVSATSRVKKSVKLPEITNIVLGGLAGEKARRVEIGNKLK